MLKPIFASILLCTILLVSFASVAALDELEGEDGQFIGNSIYGYFGSFAEEKMAFLRHVNMGGKCAYYEGDAECTLEGGSFLLPGGDDLQGYYYDDIVEAMAPYNDALAQLRLEKKGRDAACDESMGWRGDTWYSAQDCFDEVKNEYDYGKIYDKEAEQYKARKSFFKKLNEEIAKRYLTGEREEGALQSLQIAFSGYNSCMDTCDEPFGASRKSSSYCDDICVGKYQETLMKDFARYKKEELAMFESQAGIPNGPLPNDLPGQESPVQYADGEDISSLNDGSPSDSQVKSGSKIGAVFVASMFLASGIFMWYLIFKYVIGKIKGKKK